MKGIQDIIRHFNKNEKLYLLCIFLFIFIVYNINFRAVSRGGDTVPSSLLPINILDNHNLYLDRFSDIFYHDNLELKHYILEKDGHYLSSYPIVLPIMIIPIYVVPYILLKIFHYPIDITNPGFDLIIEIMEKLSASIIVSLSCIFIYLSLKELTDKKSAFVGTMVYTFATNTWTIGSQALWQHGMAELLLSIMIYSIIKNEKNENTKNYLFLGILSGLFVMNRPSNAILLLPILFYIINSHPKKSIIYYYVCMTVASLPFLIYNFYYFGNLFGGYGLKDANYFFIEYDTITRFVGLLINPNRGLFIYSPVLIFSILGFLYVPNVGNKKIRQCLYMFGISIFLEILMYSIYRGWHAGWSYGPRLLTDILPVLAIFLSLYLYNSLYRDVSIKKNLIFATLLIISIFIQIVGAFYYPNGAWDRDMGEKLWDLEDTQIKRSFLAGPILHNNPINSINRISTSRKDIVDYDNNISIHGWHRLENWNGVPIRWLKNDTKIRKYCPEKRIYTVKFDAISFYGPKDIQIYLNDKIIYQYNISNGSTQIIEIEMNFEKGFNEIKFYSPVCQRPIDVKLNNHDTRCLSVAIQNIKFEGGQ